MNITPHHSSSAGKEEVMEKWKDIKGWEGLYQVSSCGRLKSFKKEPDGRVLSNKNKKGDYFSVILNAQGRSPRHARMHVLVAEAFIPNPMCKPEVNHIDGNKQNNHVKNLEWASRVENMHHAIRMFPKVLQGMHRFNKYVKTRPILQINENGKVVGKFNNCQEAGKATGICSRNIHQVASRTEYNPGRTRSQAGGYKWRFYGD